MVHERRMNPHSFEYEMVEMDTDEVAAEAAAEGQRLMELFQLNNGARGLGVDALLRRAKQEV